MIDDFDLIRNDKRRAIIDAMHHTQNAIDAIDVAIRLGAASDYVHSALVDVQRLMIDEISNFHRDN